MHRPIKLFLVCLCSAMQSSMALAQVRIPTPAGLVRVFESTEHTVGEPEERPSISFGSQRAPELTIFLDGTKRFQAIDGFGASLTDSSAWLLRNKLSEEQFQQLMEQLFDRTKGIGLTLLRQPMGFDFTALAHVSKFVLPGARRIESNTGPGSLEDVAFRNPDGSLVLLVLNSGSKRVPFNVGWEKKFAECTLPANSAATLT